MTDFTLSTRGTGSFLEQIYVVYTPIIYQYSGNSGPSSTPFYHKEIVYERYDGTVVGLGSGPVADGKLGYNGETYQPNSSRLAEYRAYEVGRDGLIIGADLEVYVTAILQEYQRITALGLEYNPLDTNSNWSADRALIAAGIDLPTSDDPGGYWAPGSIDEGDLDNRGSKDYRGGDPNLFCFAAGTLISMADGTQKPIELIRPDDLVMSFDAEADNGRGALVPSKVTRFFRNTSPHMLDFHGTRVTPGHAFLCGDGPHEGRFRPLLDIIRDDGAVVMADGSRMRAATGCPVGSRGDAFVDLELLRLGYEHATGREIRQVLARGLVRAGATLTDETGFSYTLLDLLDAKGWTLQPDGQIVQVPGCTPAPLRSLLPALPKPEDYILARSGLTLAELYDDPRQNGQPAESARAWTAAASARTEFVSPGVLRAGGAAAKTAHGASANSAAPSSPAGPSRKARRKLQAERRKGRVRKHAGMTVH